MSACTAIVDADGIILAVNRTWEACQVPNPFLVGQGQGSDFLGTCRSLIASPDGNLSIVALGLLEIFKGKLPRLALEYPIHLDGKTCWYSLEASRGSLGNGLGFVIQILDITSKMATKQRLHRIEQLFKASTENALNLFCILDPESRIQYCSPSYQRNFGILPGDWEHQSYPSRIHDEDREVFLGHMKFCKKAGLSPLFEYRFRSKDGSWKFLEGRASLADAISGDPVSLLLISKDITLRKEAERERSLMEIQLRHGQKMEAIGQLSAGIAHEINTPTQYISDNLRFLEDSFTELCETLSKETDFLKVHQEASPTSAEIQDLLEWIQSKDFDYLLQEVPKALRQSVEGLERVSTIVQAMKAFGHPGVEGRTLVDLNQAIDTTLLVAKNEWKFVAEVEKAFDPDLPLVDCYPGEINQVFLNLLINAAHAIADQVGDSERLGCIRIQTRRADDQVEVRVSDTGTGIPEKIRDQIFLPFFTTKAVGRGSGQGLSIVHSVIAKHGGSVSFETETGKGTCFIVKLPIQRPAKAES